MFRRQFCEILKFIAFTVFSFAVFTSSVNAQDSDDDDPSQSEASHKSDTDKDNQDGNKDKKSSVRFKEEQEKNGSDTLQKESCADILREYRPYLINGVNIIGDLAYVFSSIYMFVNGQNVKNTAVNVNNSINFNDPNCTLGCAELEHIQQDMNVAQYLNTINLTLALATSLSDFILYKCCPTKYREYSSCAKIISMLPTCLSSVGFITSLIANGYVWNIDRTLLAKMPDNLKESVKKLIDVGIVNIVSTVVRTGTGFYGECYFSKKNSNEDNSAEEEPPVAVSDTPGAED